MRNILLDFALDLRDRQRVTMSLLRGQISRQSRRVDLRRPATWEFSGFSQNGEDGILEVLRSQLFCPNRYFIEIGAADGVQNNTTWLLATEQYNGIMVDGNANLIARAWRLFSGLSIGSEFHSMFVNKENVTELVALAVHHDPDIFSLDIDGNDYYVASALLATDFRPKIWVVEYNSAFGPQRSMTIAYQPTFSHYGHPTQLYYGASLRAWHKLLGKYGYQFVTVERNGVNAFFVDPSQVAREFLEQVEALQWAENRHQNTKFRCDSEGQFAMIADQVFLEI